MITALLVTIAVVVAYASLQLRTIVKYMEQFKRKFGVK